MVDLAGILSLIQFVYTSITLFYAGKPRWSAEHLPDLGSKVVIVTGGNTGIGRETVKRLLLKNAKVYLATRSRERAERAIDELREETGKEALFLQLDLNDLDAVRKAAEEFKQREPQLDVLILNAAVLCPPPEQVTPQGYDATIGVNVVGHFLFFRLLQPLLSASGRETEPSRVVWLSSIASFLPRGLVYDAYRDSPVRRGMHVFARYGQSKLCAIVVSMCVAKMCARDNVPVVSVAVDPGFIKSEIYRSSPWYLQLWDSLFWYPVEYGAVGPLYAAAAGESKTLNGKYLQPWARIASPNPAALVEKDQEKLWAWLEAQVKSYL